MPSGLYRWQRTHKGYHTKNQKGIAGVKMISIEVYASIRGHVISWLFDGEDEETALKKARRDLRKKGLRFLNYILVG